MITYQQVKVYSGECPVLDGISKPDINYLPELSVFPSRVISGDEFKFWARTKRLYSPIFVKPGEGACAESAAWAKQKRELKQVLRKMKTTNLARRTDNNDGIDQWDETRMEEMENLNEELVRSLYVKESDAAGYTFDELAVYQIDALSKDWNASQNFVTPFADPNAPTGPEQTTRTAELAAIGSLTTAYLVFLSEGGAHICWGNGDRLVYGPEREVEIRDEEKSSETGKDCTLPGVIQYVEGTVSLTAKTQYDIIKIVNIPLNALDGFFLDNVLDTVVGDFYRGTSVRPNALFVDSKVITNMMLARKKEGLESGGVNFADVMSVTGDTSGMRVPYFEQHDVSAIRSGLIPVQAEYQDPATVDGSVAREDVSNFTDPNA